MRAMSMVAFVSAVFSVTPVMADAQTKVLPAATISAAEIQALMRPPQPNTLPNIRVIDAGGHNVGIGVLSRAEGQTQNTVVNPKNRAADSIQVTREDGPGITGTAIQGGVNHELKEGDV